MKLAELRYSKRTSEGFVRFGEGVLDNAPDVVELDILKDWICELQDRYDNLHSQLFREPETKESK